MNPTIKTTPKDFFLHLSATVVLYISAGALINLLLSIINYLLPDVLAGYYYANSIAFPISMLIVLVPVLYILENLINRDIAAMPEKKDLWIRRWRIYLTIFLAAALMGGDLIVLINTYLNGEITSRFVYKVLAVLVVSGLIGKYYFFSLYTNYKWASFTRRFNTWFGAILVLAAIITGFIVVGSPTKQRNIRFDNQRVNDLSSIQWQIVNHFQQKGTLPASLAEVADPISGYAIPKDPQTETPYEYAVKSQYTFELCATFALPTQDTKGRGEYYGGRDIAMTSLIYPYPETGEAWNHEVGRTCFERTIDPEKYPQFEIYK